MRSITNTTSSGDELWPQNPRQAAARIEPVSPLVDAQDRREPVLDDAGGGEPDRVAQVAAVRVAVVDRLAGARRPSAAPRRRARRRTAREGEVAAVGAAVALGIGDDAREADEQPSGRERGRVLHRDRPRDGLGHRGAGGVRDRQQVGAGERAEVDGRLDHVALVPQTREIEDHGRGSDHHHHQQGDDDGDDPALVLESSADATGGHWPSNLASATEVMSICDPSATNLGSGVM